MIECFSVFSKVIALVCIGSQGAALRTSLPPHRMAASPALARAKEVGEPSTARIAPPASRRGMAERRELSLPPLQLECLVDRHPKRRVRFDARLQAPPFDCSKPVLAR
jgi:hypothetical protein